MYGKIPPIHTLQSDSAVACASREGFPETRARPFQPNPCRTVSAALTPPLKAPTVLEDKTGLEFYFFEYLQ